MSYTVCSVIDGLVAHKTLEVTGDTPCWGGPWISCCVFRSCYSTADWEATTSCYWTCPCITAHWMRFHHYWLAVLLAATCQHGHHCSCWSSILSCCLMMSLHSTDPLLHLLLLPRLSTGGCLRSDVPSAVSTWWCCYLMSKLFLVPEILMFSMDTIAHAVWLCQLRWTLCFHAFLAPMLVW